MPLNPLQLANLGIVDDTGGDKPAPSSLDQQANTLESLHRELSAWHARGGKIAPDDPFGGGIKMPGGTYGGEFSDEEMRGYQQAAEKYKALLAQYERERATNGRMRQASAKVTAPSDATAVRRR